MQTLKRIYAILLPATVITLAVLLYQEHRTRELAVTGARLDSIEMSLRHTEIAANISGDLDVLVKIKGARAYFEMAKQAYRQMDFDRARIHIHNTMWDLDIATHLLRLDTTQPAERQPARKPSDSK